MSESDDEFFELLGGPGDGTDEDPLENPADAIRAQCDQWVQAAHQVRFHPDNRWPGTQAPPADIKNALVHVRSRVDAIEGLLSQVIMLKAATAEAAAAAEAAADDAWDRQAQAEQNRPRPEYQGSRERYAFWNLATRSERSLAREARELAGYVRAAHDVIRLAHDGLNETRRDLASRLTHLRWETHMEQ